MNLRNAWRRTHRILGALTVPDHEVVRPAGRLVLFSCHDADRSMNVDGRRFSPLLEGIRHLFAELGCVAINLSHPQAVFRSSEVRDDTITLNYRSLGIRLRALGHRLVRRGNSLPSGLELETRMYEALLRDLDPELIISIQPPYALCRAARQMGILVVEAMHGTNYSLVDEKYFGAHMKSPDDWLPHVLVSFDEVSHATMISRCEGRDIAAMLTVNPWLHYLRFKRSDPAAPPPHQDHLKQVLVTLQWGYDGEREELREIIPNGILHPALEQVIAQSTDRFRFLIRLHPIQMNKPGYRRHRRYIESLAKRHKNLEWRESTFKPLPLLLDEASAHITMSSSSVGEAADANVPSLLLCPSLQPGGPFFGIFRELERSGKVTFGEPEPAAIVAWLDNHTSAPAERPVYDLWRHHREQLDFYSELMKRAGKETLKESCAPRAIRLSLGIPKGTC